MDYLDLALLHTTMWREDRGGGAAGMHAVASSILNRSAARKLSVYEVCTQRLQFSSVTYLGDPNTVLWGQRKDSIFLAAGELVQQAAQGRLVDVTGGAVDYYAPAAIASTAKTFTLPDGSVVPFPEDWNPAAVTFTVSVGGHLFFRES